MKGKRLWLVLGLAVVLVSVLASCGGGTTTTPATQTTTPPSGTPTTTASPTPSGKPQYGGLLTLIQPTNFTIFGPAVSNRPAGTPLLWEQITYPDRTRSVASGGTVDYADGPTSMADVIGCLASKWTTTDPYTWILDIRQGVHYSKIPNNVGSTLVNGREMTADDFVASLEFNRDTPSTWASVAEPILQKNMTVEKTGPWQVTVHTPKNPNTTYLWMMGGGGSQFIWPREWLAKYGTSNDWRVQVGTGSYYMTDFVDNSVLQMARNDNYWEKNPSGPGKGDQLPYVDNIKFLVVSDTSTQLSAIRTRKAEMMAWPATVTRDDALTLLKSNPELKYYKMLALPFQVGMRRDKADLPFKDINVRKALMMATDMQSILKDMMGGDGQILDSPARYLYPTCYTPVDQLPADVKALYTYSPDKAKQLLKDAGYPNGFNTKMVISSASPTDSDMAQTLKAQWAKVNVNVDIQIKEAGSFMQVWATRNYEEMMGTVNAGGNNALFVRYSFGYFRGTNSYNISYVNDPIGSDPIIEKAFNDECNVINVDFAAADKLHKDANVYILSQAFLIPTPAPTVYRMWQPWLKDYYGEGSNRLWIPYIWLDPKVKDQYAK